MRADSLFSPLQGGSAGEAVTRSTGRAANSPDGPDAFAGMLGRAQAEDVPSARPARSERPGSPGSGNTRVVAEGGASSEGDTAGAATVSSEADGPQVLPHDPPVADKADARDATGPQILPGADDTLESPETPPVLPHNPPMVDLSKVKDHVGPQILPGATSGPGAGKGTLLPQINPGQPTGSAEAAEDRLTEPSAPDAPVTGQESGRVLADGDAAVPPPPAVMRRLLATHEARESSKTREADRTTDKGVSGKAAATGEAAASALQSGLSVTPSPGSSPSLPSALPIAGQGVQPTPDPVLAVPQGSAETPAAPASGSDSTDLFRSALAATDRGNGLSTLSRATVETTAQIAAQIQNRLNGRSTRFEMALTPEGLGRVDVSLEIDSDGNLAARLAFDNPAAAAELRGRADELRRQLEQAGLHLEGDALQFTERDPSSGGHGFSGFDRKPFARAAALNTEADAASAAGAVWQPLTLTRDRVDLKV